MPSKWLTKADLAKYLSMDAEDLELVPWRTFQRRMQGLNITAPGWEYEVEQVEEWMAKRTEERLKRGDLAPKDE